jgi:Zn-dependent protease
MELLIGIVILLFSAILHEFMHGFVAYKLGDPTAKHAGRLTLNPIPHIDPIMSILVPAILILGHSPIFFAAAKPVPINPFNFRDGRKDIALTALAGPLTNFCVAAIAALVYHVFSSTILGDFLFTVVSFNLMLAVFNLIPVPPLDGSKVFSLLLPERTAYQYMAIGEMGIFIVLALLWIPIGGFRLGEGLDTLIFALMKLFGL